MLGPGLVTWNRRPDSPLRTVRSFSGWLIQIGREECVRRKSPPTNQKQVGYTGWAWEQGASAFILVLTKASSRRLSRNTLRTQACGEMWLGQWARFESHLPHLLTGWTGTRIWPSVSLTSKWPPFPTKSREALMDSGTRKHLAQGLAWNRVHKG